MKIPIRSKIRAPKNRLLLSIDLSQAEAWVVAYLANEPTMKLELQFGDIHTRTARAVLDIPARDLLEEERYTGKKCNHAFNYLMGPERAAEVINKEGQIVVTIKQTKQFRKKYLSLYQIESWWADVENTLNAFHEITTPYGFTRRFYNIGKEALKEAVAFIPQSTVADHMYGDIQEENPRPGGLLMVQREIIAKNKELKLIHSAHDSAIIEFPSTLDVKELYGEVKQWIQRPMIVKGEEFTIPCDAKVGEYWEEFEKVKVA